MYKTHRTEGSVVPVAVRHVSPKNPCCRKGRREGNLGEPPGERNPGERRPAGAGEQRSSEQEQSASERRPANDTRSQYTKFGKRQRKRLGRRRRSRR